MKYGGLTVTKARLLGIELELQEPSAIYVALWVAWAYFLVRYYQYFRQEAVMALMMNLNHCRTNYCMPVVRQIVAENYGTESTDHQSGHPRTVLEYHNLGRETRWKRTYKGFVHEPDDQGGQASHGVVELISLWDLRRPLAKAWYMFIVNTSGVTDYIRLS